MIQLNNVMYFFFLIIRNRFWRHNNQLRAQLSDRYKRELLSFSHVSHALIAATIWINVHRSPAGVYLRSVSAIIIALHDNVAITFSRFDKSASISPRDRAPPHLFIWFDSFRSFYNTLCLYALSPLGTFENVAGPEVKTREFLVVGSVFVESRNWASRGFPCFVCENDSRNVAVFFEYCLWWFTSSWLIVLRVAYCRVTFNNAFLEFVNCNCSNCIRFARTGCDARFELIYRLQNKCAFIEMFVVYGKLFRSGFYVFFSILFVLDPKKIKLYAIHIKKKK